MSLFGINTGMDDDDDYDDDDYEDDDEEEDYDDDDYDEDDDDDDDYEDMRDGRSNSLSFLVTKFS